MDGIQWAVLQEDRADEDQTHGDDADLYLELDELAHIIVDIATVLEGINDGREVVVKKDDVRGGMRDVSARVEHGEAYISLAESRRIIRSVASDGDDLSSLLETCD